MQTLVQQWGGLSLVVRRASYTCTRSSAMQQGIANESKEERATQPPARIVRALVLV